jgi:hypothetical protein
MDSEGVIISQYGAALAMLRSAIDASPESLWKSDAYTNRTWHVAYHALFYAHLYLSRSEGAFVPWTEGRKNAHFLGALPWPPHTKPIVGEPYSRDALLSYADQVIESVGAQVRSAPFDDPSGFEWLPMNRIELHIYNIRHIQHHAGQLIDRIRTQSGFGVEWVGLRHDSD